MAVLDRQGLGGVEQRVAHGPVVGDEDSLFVPLNEDIQLKTRNVLGVHPKLTGIGGGRNQADPFVIALAMTYPDGVVVTEETLTGNLVKPRIPDVCEAMNIRWLNLIGFVTEQGWSFQYRRRLLYPHEGPARVG